MSDQAGIAIGLADFVADGLIQCEFDSGDTSGCFMLSAPKTWTWSGSHARHSPDQARATRASSPDG